MQGPRVEPQSMEQATELGMERGRSGVCQRQKGPVQLRALPYIQIEAG